MTKQPCLQAENEQLRAGYAAARLEIESLRERVQQLGKAARDVNSRRVVELEAQLAAVGAGGVEPLRKRECLHKISEPAQPVGAAPQWVRVDERLPEPGNAVLLDIGGETPLRAMWAAKHTVEAAEDDSEWAEYSEANDTYYSPEGWYEWNQHEEVHWAVSAEPVAWMDLPAPYSADAAPQPAAQALDSVRVFWQQHTQADALSMTVAELHDDVELVIRAAPSSAAPQPAAQAGEYPELPDLYSTGAPFWRAVLAWHEAHHGPEAINAADKLDMLVADMLRAYVDADRAARGAAQAQEDAPDMFWDADDTENFAHDVQDIVDGYCSGEIVTIECAKRRPNFRVLITGAGDSLSYEHIDAASAAQQGTTDGR